MRVVTLTLHPAIDRVVRVNDLCPGDTFDSQLVLAASAGKGVNTARTLSAVWRSPEKIIAAVWLGRAEAEWYRHRLRELSGIHAAICPRECGTRHTLTILEACGRETHIKEAMAAARPGEERALLAFWKKTLRAGDIVALCGSAPSNTSAQTLRRLFDIARHKKARAIIADTNGLALDVAGAAGLDGIKGNAAEIGVWLGLRRAFDPSKLNHRRALQVALARKSAPRAIMITRGAAGALFAIAPLILFSASPPRLNQRKKTLQSATGCGDVATAGWLWGMLDGASHEEILRRAVACGTAKLTSPDPGFLDTRYLQTLLRGIGIS
ncbi:MAG: PfkB family carbohydrate kinase [Planctomycetota bacterium]